MSLADLTAALESQAVPVCHQPVFIIGSPRSGTTALARALAEHPDLWTSHESYFLNGLFGDGRASRVHTRQTERKAPGWLKTEHVDRAEFLAYVGVGLNALFTSRSGGRRWIDQTPLYTVFAEALAELFPDALFLHIVRDGRRVVNSMASFLDKFTHRPEAVRHVPGWATDFSEACRTWTEYVAHADALCDAHPTRSLTVVNEQLSEDPARGFAAILRFLGVPPSPAPAEAFGSTRVNSSYGRDADHAVARAQAWDAWTPEQRAVFMGEAGATMVRMGLADPGELRRWAAAAPPAERSAEEASA